MSQPHVSKRRIMKCKDGHRACIFQKGEIYAFGPLYEQIIEPNVPGEANIGAEQDVLQIIKSAAEVAWEYVIKRTELDPDPNTEIIGDESGIGQNSGGEGNDPEIRELLTPIDEEYNTGAGGDENVTAQATGNNTDQNVEAQAQGSQTGMGQNSGEEGNATENREATQIDEENNRGDENFTAQATDNNTNQNVEAQAQGSQVKLSVIKKLQNTWAIVKRGVGCMGQNSGGEENASKIREATQIDEGNTGGDGNVTAQATDNNTDQNVEAQAQGSQTGMGQNSGEEGNATENREATQIDEENNRGDENFTAQATDNNTNQNVEAQAQGSQVKLSVIKKLQNTWAIVKRGVGCMGQNSGGEENASKIREATQIDEGNTGGDGNVTGQATDNNTDQNVEAQAQGSQTGMGQNSGEEGNASKNREATQIDEENTEGDGNFTAQATDNSTDHNVEAQAQGSQTGMRQNSGGEQNASEISEATQIDEESTGGDGNVTGQATSNSETVEEEKIKDYYFSKIGKVIDDSMSAYDDNDMANRNNTQENKYKMLKHACLFLLQMFFFLGLRIDKLEIEGGLHEILFGSDNNDYQNRKSKFSKCMVFPGNQIPLVVLNKLIQHSFFKKVALEEKWEKPHSSDLLKSALFDLILDPVLKMNGSSSSTYSDAQTARDRLQGLVNKLINICGKQKQLSSTQDEYTDVLHGLHCRCVGTARARGEIIVEESHHQNGNVDLEAGINRNYLDPKDDDGQRIPSATTMYAEGIDFKAVSGMAIREIQLKTGCPFMGKVLHLPVFTFNEMTKEMYKSLKAYENDHGLREREVSDYLRFMCDIVRTDQDAALLELKGVIKCHSEVLIDEEHAPPPTHQHQSSKGEARHHSVSSQTMVL
nr:uncharacterized protein LOC109176010 [Ipomoea trifida]